MSVLLRGDRSQQIIILHAFIRGKFELFLNICAFTQRQLEAVLFHTVQGA